MTFEEVLDQAITMLQRRGRVTYRTLQRQFQLDDAALDDLKDALLYAHAQIHDDAGRGLVWTGDPSTAPHTAAVPTETPERTPLAYTPPYLAEKILTSRSALEGERKQVTVLFADIKDSTELIRGLDPEAAQQLLDPALHRMMDAVHRYEGTVNQVLGDGVMALFGAPIAHEDHAVRACYAALAMQAEMRPYTDEVRRTHGVELRIRVGLHSGAVVVRAIGNDLHMDYSAVGETTHLAARMEQLATPGSIRLTAETLRLAEGFIQVQSLGPVPVKGLVEPVGVSELGGASGLRRRLQVAAARGLTRFVGRQTELTALQQALARAGGGQGQVVALIGEPGVGKSRLVYEFLHSHHTQGWLILESSSVSYGKATAYLPVCDLLRAYCHLEDRDDLRTVRAKITGQILTLDDALQDTVPAVLALFEALPATVQALLAARLDRLPPEDKRLLQTAAVIGTEVPWPLLQAIADTSDEALYRSLGQLQAAEFLYETSLFPERAYTFKHALTHEVASGSLLHERRRVLHARIVAALEALAEDRLDDQVERLAHHALRGEVWDKALAYGRQAGDKALTRSAYREAVGYYEQALAALGHLPDSRAATAQAIDLRLGLRAVLNALAEARGRILDHLRRAETLAQTLGDQRRLGRVYADMGSYCWVAGDLDRAIVYDQRALALAATLGHVGLQARAHLSLGQAYYDAGDYPPAVESLGRNVATLHGELLYERFGANNIVAVPSRTYLSYCHAERGTFTEGLAMAEDGLRIAETVNHPYSLIEACRGVSFVYLRQGDVHRAIPVLERALGLCQDWHILRLLPWVAAALGVAYALDGRVAAGLALAEQGVKQAVARGRSRGLAPVVAWLSDAYLLAGRLEDAHQRAAQAIDLARQYQQRGTQAWALWLLGESTARQVAPEGEPAAGHYRQALALAEELGMRPLQAHCHRGLGTLYAAIGQREQARPELSTAIELYRTMAMTFWLPQAEAALAQMEKP